ncbi:unnamed protein product [Eruca vesicaria subsp. sativa]|uniref:Uncharacterized protein n=1 Tax=Eruca vesicaria subsp. sativa TaxID=29727 RepID=A0ABC8LDD4_ERUVS|nr:unnamed protein product [Eruca vesicaria subsp. sativa]
MILEQEEVHHLVTVKEFRLYMFPLDEDVISFELDLSEKDCLVDGDVSSLWHVAKAIHELEVGRPEIDTLIMLDREVDMVTPMCTQLTYEGLLNETLVEAESYDITELLHSYGFEHVATLNNLEKTGLFKKQEFKSNWQTVKRKLKLIVEDTDTSRPDDIAYVYSGYAPLFIPDG